MASGACIDQSSNRAADTDEGTAEGKHRRRATTRNDQRQRCQRADDCQKAGNHPLRSTASSISTDPLARKRAMPTANPTAISTAMAVITTSTNTWPL